jgi:hypothetical protein
MSIDPDSRLASSAAVFSITLTTIFLKCGGVPHQVGFGSSAMCEPLATSVMR